MKRLIALILLAVPVVTAGPSGVVMNQTTGQPESQVPVTLISFADGMDPIEEVFSDSEGRFEFQREVAGMGMLRAEHQAVGYSQVLQPGKMTGVELQIFESKATPAVVPTGRVLVLEPGEAEMIVNESYLYENKTSPPTTFRDENAGTLRFYLPEAAKGIVQVEANGPARMPLKANAEKVNDEGLYQVDFAIKPGENRISLTYLLPVDAEGTVFESRSPYAGITTRIAAPTSVELEAEGLQQLGTEPSTQAGIYEVAKGDAFSLTVRGAGKLARSEQGPAAGGGEFGSGAPNQISIQPAPIAKDRWWVMALAGAILLIGFIYLLGVREKA